MLGSRGTPLLEVFVISEIQWSGEESYGAWVIPPEIRALGAIGAKGVRVPQFFFCFSFWSLLNFLSWSLSCRCTTLLILGKFYPRYTLQITKSAFATVTANCNCAQVFYFSALESAQFVPFTAKALNFLGGCLKSFLTLGCLFIFFKHPPRNQICINTIRMRSTVQYGAKLPSRF